jgi:hypothetical protein
VAVLGSAHVENVVEYLPDDIDPEIIGPAYHELSLADVFDHLARLFILGSVLLALYSVLLFLVRIGVLMM